MDNCKFEKCFGDFCRGLWGSVPPVLNQQKVRPGLCSIHTLTPTVSVKHLARCIQATRTWLDFCGNRPFRLEPFFRAGRGLMDALGDLLGGGDGDASPRILSKLASSRVASPASPPNGKVGGGGGGGKGAGGGAGSLGA